MIGKWILRNEGNALVFKLPACFGPTGLRQTCSRDVVCNNPPLMKTRSSASRIAWLAILAMVWHALLPLAHAAGTQQGVLASICSVGTPRQALIELPGGKQDAPALDLLKQCPLCATGAHFALADEPRQAFAADASLAHVQASIFLPSASRVLAWLNFSPRAPPLA